MFTSFNLTFNCPGCWFTNKSSWWPNLHMAFWPISVMWMETRHPSDQQLAVYVWFYLHYVRLEPLLMRISQKRTAIVCPIVDAIDDTTLKYSLNGGYQVGGFTWSGHFTWEDVPARDKENRKYTDAVRYLVNIWLTKAAFIFFWSPILWGFFLFRGLGYILLCWLSWKIMGVSVWYLSFCVIPGLSVAKSLSSGSTLDLIWRPLGCRKVKNRRLHFSEHTLIPSSSDTAWLW